MLTLFKSQEQRVAEIHNEFDNAQDNLLRQAEEIIAKSANSELKAIRLINIGFTKTREAARFLKTGITKAQADLIRYYKQTYPFQKFISEEELNRICKKYGLIHAPISAYKKDVPEKNLSDMENMPQLKPGDETADKVYTVIKYGWDFVGISWPRAKLMGLPKVIPDFEATFFFYIDSWLKENYPKVASRDYICTGGTIHKESRQGLHIAAPKSHFDLKGLGKTGVFGFSTIQLIEVKDPIVFRYVRGGVQIITKWGLEAEDKTLLNEIEN